ncbi:DHR-2 domain [Phytophthora cactorum]|nr:DHR-2 domain [Phytophthora cactorum]
MPTANEASQQRGNSSTVDQQLEEGELTDGVWTEHGSGFGIPTGTLELVEVERREWRRSMVLPLPPPSPVDAPILQEFSRPWRALRLPIPTNSGEETKAATEDFCFRIPGPMLDKADSTIPPAALMYVLPTLQMQNLYLVLKVSKVLAGDGDIAAAPYCTPDKFASTSEQKKLVEKAVDCGLRLGRFQQPLAWGTIPLSHSRHFEVSALLWIHVGYEASRWGFFIVSREKVVPAVCEFDVDDISAEELVDAKFKSPTSLSPSPPRLKIADPFSEQTSGNTESETSDAVELQGDKVLHCREVQPFCTSSLVPKFGLVGSGPVAVSYVNTLYVYPLQIEKCQYRNIAIRVQLLQREVDTVRGVEETEEAVLRAVYRANNLVDRSAYALVGYHQKNPQFDDEMKICLPECLTREHHLLFTFYHVHCKKLQPNQPQQEVVGYAAIPILGKDGTILQDGKYVMNVTPAPVSSKPLATGGEFRYPLVTSLQQELPLWTTARQCLAAAVAWYQTRQHEDVIVNRLMGLSQGSALNVRYFFFMIAKFVLGYLRHGTSIVRWSAFRTLLAIMEKATWNPRGSLKVHEMNRVLHDFVHIVFDEKSIDDPSKHQFSAKSPPKSERKSVFSALLETWLNVLNNKASIEENADTKRMSLTYSNVLLQLILKSMAMNLLDTTNDGAASSLPMMLAKNDEVMLERVLDQLIACAGDTSNGLLLQKEVNRSVAYFCRGVFLVVNNVFPARVIDRYVKWIDVQGDANSLRHIWFPFLHILVDFEFFPTVNGAVERNSVKARAWLAKAVSEKLLVIIDTQKEQKIRVDAVRLLRRMFAAQAYNPRFQGLENQEGIALLYYPLFPSLVQFTTPGKLLASSIPGLSGEAKSVLDLQKEMMACVGHLLCSVSRPQLPYFFRPFEGVSTQVHETHLDFTDQLAFYHRVVGQQKLTQTFETLANNTALDDNSENKCAGFQPTRTQHSLYDEARVHASLALVQRLLEIFLIAESSKTNGVKLWHQLLSPDLGASESETGLSLLENHLAHRRSIHRRTGGLESPVLLSPKSTPTDSFSDTPQNAADGNTTHRSLPRNWSKQYANQQRRSAAGLEEKAAPTPSVHKLEEVTGGQHAEEIAALQQVVASTALRVIQTAVDQYEAVIRLIEVARTPRLGTPDRPEVADDSSLKAVSTNQAFVLLGYITELLFHLLQQASSISGLAGELEHDTNTKDEHPIEDNDDSAADDTKSCFVTTLLQYLQAFVWRFSAALFAARISGLPLAHDHCRIQLIMSIAATAKRFSVRRQAAMLLSQLLSVCYEQTGSFLLVKAPILKVLTTAFFPTPSKPSALKVSTISFRDLLDEMRAFATLSRDKVLSLPSSFHIQYIELLNDLTTKVHAYERWHSAFEDPGGAHDFEEIEEGIDRVVEDISPHWLLEEKLVWLNSLLRLHLRRDSLYLGRVQQWVIRELFVARGYAKRADWIEKELSICELLLGCLKQQRRFNEYQEMLRCIDALVGRLAERQESSGVQQHNSAFSFYRVRYAGGCVPALITKDEFIYKRSKFVSLGEFVGEMKTMLRAKYPQCERVDVVPEPKPLTGGDSNPNVIFLRVTTVEEALPIDLTRLKATQPRSSNWRVAFKFALRHEEVRCPIENSMDDIQKRCALLRAEIDKENVGKTDLKTLTLVLKGSVDTHVHGGIPEVLDSFLAGDPAQLVDAEGRCMSSHDSLKKRHELANLLVDFAQLCWQCLLISRETFRRSSQPTSQHVSASSTAFHPELLPHHFDLHQPDAANDNFLPPLPDTNLLFIRTIVDSSSPQQDTELSPALLVEVSPLQTEFERSFASLVDQLTSKIPFTYKNAAKLSRLRFSLPSSSPAPVAPLPDSIH